MIENRNVNIITDADVIWRLRIKLHVTRLCF